MALGIIDPALVFCVCNDPPIGNGHGFYKFYLSSVFVMISLLYLTYTTQYRKVVVDMF